MWRSWSTGEATLPECYLALAALDLAALADDPVAEGAARLTADPARACRTLDSLAVKAVQRASGVRHARHAAFAVAAGALVARLVVEHEALDPSEAAVIATGGIEHLDVCWAFTQRALELGARMLNPLAFPHTLPSAHAVGIAARLGAHGPALAVGHDELAFGSAVRTASLLVGGGAVPNALVVSVCHASSLLMRRHAVVPLPTAPADFAICALVTREPIVEGATRLRVSESTRAQTSPICEIRAGGQITADELTSFGQHYLGPATLGFACLVALAKRRTAKLEQVSLCAMRRGRVIDFVLG